MDDYVDSVRFYEAIGYFHVEIPYFAVKTRDLFGVPVYVKIDVVNPYDLIAAVPKNEDSNIHWYVRFAGVVHREGRRRVTIHHVEEIYKVKGFLGIIF